MNNPLEYATLAKLLSQNQKQILDYELSLLDFSEQHSDSLAFVNRSPMSFALPEPLLEAAGFAPLPSQPQDSGRDGGEGAQISGGLNENGGISATDTNSETKEASAELEQPHFAPAILRLSTCPAISQTPNEFIPDSLPLRLYPFAPSSSEGDTKASDSKESDTKEQTAIGHGESPSGGDPLQCPIELKSPSGAIGFELNIDSYLEAAALLSRHPHLQGALLPLADLAKGEAGFFGKCKLGFLEMAHNKRRYYLEKILLGRLPSAAFQWLQELGLLRLILPELAAGKGVSQNRFHKYDVYEHSLYSCDFMEEPDVILKLSALLHDIGKVPTRKEKENGEASFYNHEIISSRLVVPIMKRFGIPKEVGLQVKFYVRNHMFHYTSEWSDRAIRRFLKKVSLIELENLIKLRKADRQGSGKKNPLPKGLQKLIQHIEDVIQQDRELKVTDLAFKGADLLTIGLSEGPAIGKILKVLLDEVKGETLENDYETLKQRAMGLIEERPEYLLNTRGSQKGSPHILK